MKKWMQIKCISLHLLVQNTSAFKNFREILYLNLVRSLHLTNYYILVRDVKATAHSDVTDIGNN